MLRILIAVLLALPLLGCTASDRLEDVEAEVVKFHQLLDEERFEAIWFQGSTEFQKVVKREEFVAFVSAVHRKLGRVKTASRLSWQVNYTTGGTLVAVSYKTEFDDSEATEQFICQNDGAKPQLMRYNISSNALVTK